MFWCMQSIFKYISDVAVEDAYIKTEPHHMLHQSQKGNYTACSVLT